MYQMPQEHIDGYLAKHTVSKKPLPPEFLKHKELITKIQRADRLYLYSDDASVCRSGRALQEELMLLKAEAKLLAETDAERELLDKLEKYYQYPSFYDFFPELSHPQFTGKEEIHLNQFEQFIDKVGIGKLESLFIQLNDTNNQLIELINEVDAKLAEFLNESVRGRYFVYRDPSIKTRALISDPRYHLSVKGNCVLIPESLHNRIGEFLINHADSLAWMNYYYKCCYGFEGFYQHSTSDIPTATVHILKCNPKKDGVKFPEIYLGLGQKQFRCIVHHTWHRLNLKIFELEGGVL